MARVDQQAVPAAVNATMHFAPADGGASWMEQHLERHGFAHIAGVDEAGRGACCGPVTIAACVLPPVPIPELAALTDSKKISPNRREKLFDIIVDKAVDFTVVHIGAAEIDARGIQHANLSGMRRALARLDQPVSYVLSDAMKIPGLTVPHLPIIGGDAAARCISAASVLAKVSRDRLMVELDDEYPGYGLAKHKGYGTIAHREAIAQLGASKHHRHSYANVAAAHAEWQRRVDTFGS